MIPDEALGIRRHEEFGRSFEAAPGQSLLGKARAGRPDKRMRRRQQQEVHERAERTAVAEVHALVSLRLELLRRPRQAAVVAVVLGRRSDRGEVHLRMSRCGLDNGCIVGRDQYRARLAQPARAAHENIRDARPTC